MSAESSRPKVNLRSTAVKRIMQEASELANPDEDDFVAGPLETDIFEWHCTMRGVKGSEYDGGLYHLRILLPASYPMSAPDIMLLTPNGRFELGKKICIDGLTSFHAGSWQPAWGVRTAITGLRSFWMQDGEALSAIGALDCPKEEKRRLAKLSREWVCPTCGVPNHELLPDSAGTSGVAQARASTSTPTPQVSEGPSEVVASSPSCSTPPASASDPTNADGHTVPAPPSEAGTPDPIAVSRHPSPLSTANSSISPTVVPPHPVLAAHPAGTAPPPGTAAYTQAAAPAYNPALSRRPPPKWIDVSIGILSFMLFIMLADKYI